MLSPLKRLVMAVLAISLIAGLAGGSPAAHAEPAEAGARFTLGILPDTQFYSRYATQGQGDLFMERYGSNPFASQTQFWADHAEDYNTQMVLHLGDVVDRAGQDQEWEVADASMRIMEDAGINYSVIGGNHDMPYERYLAAFGPERAALNETLVERDATYGAHEYHQFTVDGQTFAVLALSWGAQAVRWRGPMPC